jgi:predicted amidohydrolase
MKAATIQMSPVFKDRLANLRRAASLVKEACTGGAKLVVLPELCTTGYSFMSRQDAEPYAETLRYPSSEVQAEKSSLLVFRALAKQYGAHIVWGVLEKSTATGNLFNSQVLMCPDGTYETYSKINFFGNDYLWATGGRANPPIRRIAVDGKVKKVGLLICRDVRDKKDSNWSSFYEPGDADVVCLSANWGDGGFPATAWMDFAKDNRTTLIVSNRYGRECPNNFGEGGVCIIKPDGSVNCAGLLWEKDCIVYGEV